MIIVNFKNYKIGKDVLKLVKLIEKCNKKIIVAVPAINLNDVVENTHLNVYAQHIDNYSIGRGTGCTIAEALKEIGVNGSLINHSEHRIGFSDIKDLIEKCKKLKLKSIVCAKDLKEIKKVRKLKPYAIAYEDPNLIASGNSIVKYKSGNIKKFVNILKSSGIVPICGAGINSKEDILGAYSFGCKGVLIASAIANAKNPEKLLKEIKNFK